MNIAAAVVIYNPDEGVSERISSYAGEVLKVFVVDNSDQPDESVLNRIREVSDNIEIIPMHGNKGIAAALNAALNKASEQGADYLLTMDDDSYFTGDTLPKYLERAEEIFTHEDKVIQIGIHNSGDKDDDLVVNNENPEWLITSGSVMDVKASVAVGGFLEKLFIDEVDREFCYRASAEGYRMRRVLDLTMQHNLGAPIRGKLFGREFEAMGHSKVRKYYIFRNCTYVMMTYPQTRKPYRHFLFATWLKTILVEDDKINKLKYMRMGKRDARKGKFGKLEV
ncbi:MAG: glycosyltransferase [Clostridiales bacterium]|nr:glycosyltransferase [Clostridiales bacterium]